MAKTVNLHWIKGSEIKDHPAKVKVIESFYYCRFCLNEAYWDTDYGQQLFDYCPYCGKKMRGKVKKNE